MTPIHYEKTWEIWSLGNSARVWCHITRYGANIHYKGGTEIQPFAHER